jgi:hypothetical protein
MARKEMDCGRKMISELYFRVFLRVFPRRTAKLTEGVLQPNSVEKPIIREISNFLINKF